VQAVIRAGLIVRLPAAVVDELLTAYVEAKRNFYLGGLRLSAVEGGRFCEAAYRLLQHIATGSSDALGSSLDTERIARQLANLAATSQPDSVRLHIPRALRVVYDIRNNRDAAHLADGIDPNLQDASLVISVLDEFVRLFHNVTADRAQALVQGIVTKEAPAVEDFDGFLKVLKTNLSASSFAMLLLYQRGAEGATLAELDQWARPTMRRNLRRTLHRLVNDQAFVHATGSRFHITRSGQKEVERLGLIRVE
jgi:hypothetical protein